MGASFLCSQVLLALSGKSLLSYKAIDACLVTQESLALPDKWLASLTCRQKRIKKAGNVLTCSSMLLVIHTITAFLALLLPLPDLHPVFLLRQPCLFFQNERKFPESYFHLLHKPKLWFPFQPTQKTVPFWQ